MGYRIAGRIAAALVLVAALAGAGMYGYNLGVMRGLADSARFVAAPAAGAPVVMIWPHPWGYGFGFFPIFPLFFLFLFGFVALRALFWRRARWDRGCGGGWTPGQPPQSSVNL